MPFDMSIVGKQSDVSSCDYTWRDTALYALGVGSRKDELDYLYEGRGPKVIPSFAVVPKFKPMIDLLAKTGGTMAMVVHAAERVHVSKPFPPFGTLRTVAKIRGIYDMRKFASVLIDTETTDAGGDVLATTTSTMLCRGEGGWGGEPPPKESSGIVVPKGTSSTFRIEEPTSAEQALLYRLSGDYNPLHADPEFATGVGFARGPILHGLCTFGFMVRHAAKGACGGDATRMTGFEASFKKPVWPGETIVTEGWVVAPGKVALQVSVKERGELVLGGAWATFRD